eukprot:COSAG05_NODE_273_length_12440_cov_22.182805_14_plen_97_part_00
MAVCSYLEAVDEVVRGLGESLPELRTRQIERGAAMVTCYPGGGSHYIRHVDNPNKNGTYATLLLSPCYYSQLHVKYYIVNHELRLLLALTAFCRTF